MNYLSYIKYGVIILAVALAVWFYKDWERKGYEAERLAENNRQEKIVDSLKVAFYVYDKKQMENYAKENIAFKNALKENNIKLNRVTSVMNHLLKYRDTTIVETDFSNVISAINQRKPIKQEFSDSTACMAIKGYMEYTPEFIKDEFNVLNGNVPLSSNGTEGLKLFITSKEFNNKTTAVAYWERNLWTIAFGIKTRLFGRRIGTVKLIDKCGESQIINISKKEN